MTVQELFGVELPVIQAPMAGVQDSAMAVAVCEAGGLGSLPCALFGPDEVRSQLLAIRDATSKPFNVNFFCHAEPTADPDVEARWLDALSPYLDELGIDRSTVPSGAGRGSFDPRMAEILEEFEPPVVSFHFGLPSPELMERIRAWGPKIISSATTVDEARWLADRGVDAVIAQGVEAGGHRGMFLTDDLNTQTGTFALASQIVDAVDVPVIAAGGIADARGVRAAMALGAAGAQVGTAYLLCDEALTSPIHRAALKTDAPTALTNVFTGRPARGIVNRIVRELGPMSDAAPPFPLATMPVLMLRGAAEKLDASADPMDFTSLWSGQNRSGCAEIGAAALTRSLSPDASA